METPTIDIQTEIASVLARKDVSDLYKQYMIGNLYNKSKLSQGGVRVAGESKGKTSELIARQCNISARTVYDYEAFAEAVDNLVKLNTKSKDILLSGYLTMTDITHLSRYIIDNKRVISMVLTALSKLPLTDASIDAVKEIMADVERRVYDPDIEELKDSEREILEEWETKGYALANIDVHRTLWYYTKHKGNGVYIGRRDNPTTPKKNNLNNKWSNPFIVDGTAWTVDGTLDDVLDSYYLYISGKRSLQEKLKPELDGKILFCHCKTNKCHGRILLALMSGELKPANLSRVSEKLAHLWE